jgi:hypothetical protein
LKVDVQGKSKDIFFCEVRNLGCVDGEKVLFSSYWNNLFNWPGAGGFVDGSIKLISNFGIDESGDPIFN